MKKLSLEASAPRVCSLVDGRRTCVGECVESRLEQRAAQRATARGIYRYSARRGAAAI